MTEPAVKIEVAAGLIKAAVIFQKIDKYLSWFKAAKGSFPDRVVLHGKDYKTLHARVLARFEKKDAPPPERLSAAIPRHLDCA